MDNRRIKVAYVSSSDAVHSYNFFQYLTKEGVEIHWILLERECDENLLIPKKDFLSISGVHIYDFIEEYPRRIEKEISMGIRYSRMKRFLDQALFVRRCLKKIKPDLLHGNFIQYDGMLAALSGFHPFLEAVWGSDVLINPQNSFYARQALRFVAKKADAIHCDCKVVRDTIQKYIKIPQSKFHVFPQLGVDISFFSPAIDRNSRLAIENKRRRKILITTRSLEPIYGVETLLSAVPAISNMYDVHVLIVGEGESRQDLMSLSKQLNVENRVTFCDRIDNSLMPEYLRKSDLYISASYSDGSSQSLLEAMSCGKPLVISDIPANREWVTDGKNGLLFNPGDCKMLAAKVIELLGDDDRCLKMGEINSKIARDKIDIVKNTKRLIQLYHDLRKIYAI